MKVLQRNNGGPKIPKFLHTPVILETYNHTLHRKYRQTKCMKEKWN